MAELEEEIIIIEDSDVLEASSSEKTAQENLDNGSKMKKLLIFGGLGATLLIIVITIIILLLSSKDEVTTFDLDFIDEKLEKPSIKPVEPSKLENMIAKANYLYTTGSQEKALTIYEKIAEYSEAISEYNLGVAQLKNEQYEIALQTFSKAIKNDEKRCVSAINAAVCSLHLKDKESFKYYIDLAYAYLPYEINSPLYSYYYTLISYYNKDYLNALNSLKNASSNEYPQVTKNLTTKINALFDNDYAAIEAMEKNLTDYDEFSIGLLYARIGDLTLAISHFEEAIVKNIQASKAQLALGLINLKAGHLQTASTQISNVTDMYPQEVYKHYPIKVKLKESIFDTEKAQYFYRNTMISSKTATYQKIFYFSPYKIFNSNKTISYIRKGNANIYIDNVESAKKYLRNSSASSSVNAGITKAIKKALSLRIREANNDLKELIKIQPKHSTLHYNLALTYAQMGNMPLAHKHFLRSYYLDAKNYLSGVYAVMTSQLIYKDSTKLRSILIEAITNEDESEEKELLLTLLYISQNNYISAIDWLDHDYTQRPLYLALNTLIAIKLNKQEIAQKATEKLVILHQRDILPHLMYIDAHFSNYSDKKYAIEVMIYLKKQNFNFNDLYFGPYITRFLYIQQNLISGRLYFLRQQLKRVLEETDQPTYEIESALALTLLYEKRFEEAYILYNHLIDELKVQDAYTLFLGAVASTGAGHHGNAIALLELSKLKNGSFYESRYALALLYLEIRNNEGAVIQLSKIDRDGFISQYFDFAIDTNKLLFQKQNPNK